MRRPVASLVLLLPLVAFVAVVVSASARSGSANPAHSASVLDASAASRPLATAVLDPANLGGSESDAAYANLRRSGAGFVRMFVDWTHVAPGGSTKPVGFDARDPGDRAYRWAALDDQVRQAAAKGFTSIVYVQTAPRWAQSCAQGPGPCRPKPTELAAFMTAASRRYSGTFGDLPRVRYWQIWNEPNLNAYLVPQYDAKGRPASPDTYRAMVNAAADAIHSVKKDNVVIAGGQSPFGPDAQSADRVAPLKFMRQLLCLSAGKSPKAVCRKRVRFDVWAHHPYTSGGPMHHANGKDDVSLPDLWKMKVLLDAAVRTGNLASRGPVRFWVTEFAWDTSPPDPKGVPEQLHARWVAEALYRMWSQGVSLVTWFQVRDQPFTSSTPFQSGLYFRGAGGIASDEPKLALTAFRFPFVAFRDGKEILFWGRSPAGRAAAIVEQKTSGEWRLVQTMRPNSTGIFSGQYASSARAGSLRARLANGKDAALAFSLTVPPDRPGCAWGTC